MLIIPTTVLACMILQFVNIKTKQVLLLAKNIIMGFKSPNFINWKNKNANSKSLLSYVK